MRRIVFVAGLVGSIASAQKAAAANPDDRISYQVQMRLATDPDVKGGALTVSVRNGVVTISGRVDSEKGRDRATKIVKKVKGVKGVDNELVVGPPK
jgi:osmotically-inducible protein OsmY